MKPTESEPWAEPARAIPLRWGNYNLRYSAGLALCILGAIVVLLTSAFSLIALPIGILVQILGWLILPSLGWRRIVAAILASFASMVLLNGASATIFVDLPLAGWLLIRLRPIVSYLSLAVPLIVSLPLVLIFRDYGNYPILFGIMLITGCASAWLGRFLAMIPGRFSAKRR